MREQKNDNHELEDNIKSFGLSMKIEPSKIEIIDLEQPDNFRQQYQLRIVEVEIFGNRAQEQNYDSQKIDEKE